MAASGMQWGAWAGAGMAAGDASTAARVERTGMALLEPHQGLAVLAGMVVRSAAPSPVLAANAFVWPKFMQRFGSAASVPQLFAEFAEFAEFADSPGGTEAGAAAAAGSRHGATSGAGRSSGRDGGMGARLTPEERGAAVLAQVQDAVRSILGSDLDPEQPLMAAGLDSLGAVELKNSLEGRLGVQLPGTLVFDYPTTTALAGYLETVLPAVEDDSEEAGDGASSYAELELAVSPSATRGLVHAAGPGLRPGMVVALLGASSCSAHDAILSTSPLDIIAPVPLDHWDVEALSQGATLPALFGGYLPGADLFDAGMFGLSTGEAELMDAQQRLLMQLALEVGLDGLGLLWRLISSTDLSGLPAACLLEPCLTSALARVVLLHLPASRPLWPPAKAPRKPATQQWLWALPRPNTTTTLCLASPRASAPTAPPAAHSAWPAAA